MKNKVKEKKKKSLLIFIISFIIITNFITVISLAEEPIEFEQTEIINEITSDVEVVHSIQFGNYKERRKTNGFMFNFHAENLYLPDYISLIDLSNTTATTENQPRIYETMFGQSDITLASIDLGYKFNFSLGALVFGASYGEGSLSDDRITFERVLKVQKQTVMVQYILDTLFEEPYVVPYVSFEYGNIVLSEKGKMLVTDVEEKEITQNVSGSNVLKIGMLFSLNWMDKDSAKEAYIANGLENTYFEIYMSQYVGGGNETSSNIDTDPNWGAGLRLEF